MKPNGKIIIQPGELSRNHPPPRWRNLSRPVWTSQSWSARNVLSPEFKIKILKRDSRLSVQGILGIINRITLTQKDTRSRSFWWSHEGSFSTSNEPDLPWQTLPQKRDGRSALRICQPWYLSLSPPSHPKSKITFPENHLLTRPARHQGQHGQR